MTKRDESKAKGGQARAEALTPKRRTEIAQIAATARWSKDLPQATHESSITLGDLEVECAVLEDGTRVISERAMTRAFGGKRGGSHWKRLKAGGATLPVYLSAKNYSQFISEDVSKALANPIRYKTSRGQLANGLDAKLLPEVCNVFLKARDAKELHPSQVTLATQADIIMRGLAAVGIIALIDEATGYQADRAVDALAKILEQFIAKELRPWVHTFPDVFYRELFRIRGLEFPQDKVSRPKYFGHLTNDIIYERLAPGVLAELKNKTPKDDSGRRKHHLHRRLSAELGHPKLVAHLEAVIAVMKLSDDDDYKGFIKNLDRVKPRYKDTLQLPLSD